VPLPQNQPSLPTALGGPQEEPWRKSLVQFRVRVNFNEPSISQPGKTEPPSEMPGFLGFCACFLELTRDVDGTTSHMWCRRSMRTPHDVLFMHWMSGHTMESNRSTRDGTEVLALPRIPFFFNQFPQPFPELLWCGMAASVFPRKMTRLPVQSSQNTRPTVAMVGL
jgi:hypothetical protein